MVNHMQGDGDKDVSRKIRHKNKSEGELRKENERYIYCPLCGGNGKNNSKYVPFGLG